MRQEMNWSREIKSRALEIICVEASRFATRAGAVLTSPYPSVDSVTRGFVRLR